MEIACADEAAEIRYTTDGSEPTSSSALYEGPFTVSSTTTVKAKAFLVGEWGGDTATATITKGTYYGGLYPDTPASHAKHWLDEREEMQELTGTWQDPFEYVDGKITFDGENVFTTTEPSKGVRTTLRSRDGYRPCFGFGVDGCNGSQTGLHFAYHNGSVPVFNPAAANTSGVWNTGGNIVIGSTAFPLNEKCHVAFTVVPDGTGNATICAYIHKADATLVGSGTWPYGSWTTSKIVQNAFMLGRGIYNTIFP